MLMPKILFSKHYFHWWRRAVEAIKPESGSGSTGIRAGVQPESEGVQPYFSSKEAVKPEPTACVRCALKTSLDYPVMAG